MGPWFCSDDSSAKSQICRLNPPAQCGQNWGCRSQGWRSRGRLASGWGGIKKRSQTIDHKAKGGAIHMLNRRQFVGAASAALFAGASNARAAVYDLVIKGGRVIDPSIELDAVRDIGIAGGSIVTIGANLEGDAAETIDARGKIVAP